MTPALPPCFFVQGVRGFGRGARAFSGRWRIGLLTPRPSRVYVDHPKRKWSGRSGLVSARVVVSWGVALAIVEVVIGEAPVTAGVTHPSPSPNARQRQELEFRWGLREWRELGLRYLETRCSPMMSFHAHADWRLATLGPPGEG